MWEDIGLSGWRFNLDDEIQVAKVEPAVFRTALDLKGATAKAAQARQFVEDRQRETMMRLSSGLKEV